MNEAMMDFGRALLGDPPIEEASGFFIRIKTAGWTDPPDETGELEGPFAAPIEQVIAVAGEAAKMVMELSIAYDTLTASARGPGAAHLEKVRCWGIGDAFKYLVQRMATLGGPVHLPEVEPPPASSDPVSITKMLIRKEQEVISVLSALKTAVGDENPMASSVKRYMTEGQQRLDDLWKGLERETAPVIENAAPPAEEGMPEGEDIDPELGNAGVPGMPIGEGAEEKTAAQDDSPEQRFVAEAKRQGMRRGAKKGATRGGVEGAVGGAGVGALTGRILKGKGGGLRGAAIGALAGGALGAATSGAAGAYRGRKRGEREALGQLSGAKHAYALGAGVGALAGGAGGYALAPEEHKLLGALGGASVGALGGARAQRGVRAVKRAMGRRADTATPTSVKETAAQVAAGDRREQQVADFNRTQAANRAAGKVAPVRSIASSVKSKSSSVADRFKGALQKMAEGESVEAAEMTAPSGGDPRQSAIHYLEAEQAGRRAQDQNESTQYKQQLMQAQAQNQGLQQQVQMAQQQLMQVQQQAQEASAQIEQSTQQAVQANDVAMQQSQQAAQMRMGMQQMRAQMLQVASQEPDAIAQQMQQEQAQAQAQQLQTELQPPAEGAQPTPATPQKAEQEAAEAQKAQGQAQEQTQQAEQAAQGAQMKAAAADLASFAAPMAGAAIGAGGSLLQSYKGEEGLEKRRQGIQNLEGKGGFVNAMRMAQAKAGLASAEMSVKHPIGSALMGAGAGALTGAGLGKETSKRLGNIQGFSNEKGKLMGMAAKMRAR